MRRAPLPSRHGRFAAAGATTAIAATALLLLLAGCTGALDEDARMSPAANALVASAPTMATTRVPAPPVLAASASAAAPGDLASVHAQLESLLGQASACKADAECRTVATGAKACGGPTAYRAYSSVQADPAKVEALAQREHELGMAQARQSGQVSACFMLGDPGAHCEQHKCVTGPA